MVWCRVVVLLILFILNSRLVIFMSRWRIVLLPRVIVVYRLRIVAILVWRSVAWLR